MATKAQRQVWAEEKKIIESRLHPLPQFGDVTIRHEHRGRMIEFTAWRGDSRVNASAVIRNRNDFLYVEKPLDEEDIKFLLYEPRR